MQASNSIKEETMKPMLDPKRDLVGATPETLARALFRPLRPHRAKAVVRDEIPIEEVATDHPSDSVAHLRKRS